MLKTQKYTKTYIVSKPILQLKLIARSLLVPLCHFQIKKPTINRISTP